MEQTKKPRSGLDKKRTALIVVCCVLAVILVALIALTVWVKSLLGGIDRITGSEATLSPDQLASILEATDASDPDFTGAVIDGTDATVPSSSAVNITNTDNTVNFLLVGQDRREGMPRMHSDAMILVTINKSAKTLTMTSFLRDTWVYIPGYYNERLNVPYMIGGFPLLDETLNYTFGVSADYNIEVDFSGFQEAIDLVGGVDIDLTAAEASHLNGQNAAWTLVAGENHLNGEQALAYSRIRALDNDLGRSSRQRTVLMALIDKAKTLSLTQLLGLAQGIIPMLSTDMTDSDIISCVTELAPLLPELQIVSQRIPADGAYEFATIDGKSVIYLNSTNLEKNLKILRGTVGAE